MKYKVVTLCGSLRFGREIWDQISRKLVDSGYIVLKPDFCFTKDEEKMFKKKLKLMHRQKIDMSDEIFIINKNGYIGESTKAEIEYAKLNEKKVSYLES